MGIFTKWKKDEKLKAFRELKKELQQLVMQEEADETSPDYVPLTSFLPEAEKLLANKDKIYGIATGYRKLDQILKGISPGELIVIGGPTGTGKTMFGTNILLNGLTRQLFSTLVISMEMTAIQFTARTKQIVDDGEYQGEVAAMPFYFFQHKVQEPTISNIRALAKAMKPKVGCDVIFIDHLHCWSRSVENQGNEIGAIVRALKKIALDLEIAIVLVSHVRKGQPGSRNPVNMNDLRGSSFIAQDADTVIMLNRGENNQILQVKVEKNRNKGELGGVQMSINKNSYRLTELPY